MKNVKCTKQLVLTAVRNVKFLLNQIKKDQFTAGNVIETTDHKEETTEDTKLIILN